MSCSFGDNLWAVRVEVSAVETYDTDEKNTDVAWKFIINFIYLHNNILGGVEWAKWDIAAVTMSPPLYKMSFVLSVSGITTSPNHLPSIFDVESYARPNS